MGCIRGKSICETCGKEFLWRKHDSQPDRRFCSRKCSNRDFGIKGNQDRLFWPKATEEQKKQRMIEFFEKKVIRQKGCWGWKGNIDKNGYAQLTGHNGNRFIPIKAHRFSFEIHKGRIVEGMLVCHTCDNPKCTNPEHLWLGTTKENTNDCLNKKRFSIGEKRPLAKLKEDDIREIRKMLNLGVTKANLSRKYEVSFMTISLIAQGKTWRHVKEDLNVL